MQNGKQRRPLQTRSLLITVHPDHKMYASQKRFGRHLTTKSVAERDFASRRQDIDDTERLTLQKLKLEKLKVWEDLRRINVRSRSLKRGSLIEREILAERKKLEKRCEEEQRPVSSAAIRNHLSGSLVITGVQPRHRPLFRDGIRPRTTATHRVALSVRQIEALRPKTAGALVACPRSVTHHDSQDLFPAAINRQLLKAERLADSLDNLHIRHFLSPEELKAVDGNNRYPHKTRHAQSGRHTRHLFMSAPVRASSDDGLQAHVMDEASILLDAESVQPKRLLQRNRSANRLRKKSLSMNDVSQFKDTSEAHGPSGEDRRKTGSGCDKLASKGLITRPVTNHTVVKLPTAGPDDDNDDVAESS